MQVLNTTDDDKPYTRLVAGSGAGTAAAPTRCALASAN